MGILATDLREIVIRPTLKKLNLWSESAENLLMGTAAQESQMGRYLMQINGIAIGVFQCEPATHDDIWSRYLVHKGNLTAAILRLVAMKQPKLDQLAWNLSYAAAICRVHYLRVPSALPDPNDIEALGHYWKNHYNTHLGRGTVEEFIKSYTAMVL